MLIGVISDSHDNIYALRKALNLLVDQGVELVIHLGDIVSPFTVKLMKDILRDIDVIVVKGNNDGDLIQLNNLFTKYKWILKLEPGLIEVDNRKLYLLHGYGSVEETIESVNKLVESVKTDIILYGHTHRYSLEEVNGKLVVNPGEICGYLTGTVSFATIDLKTLKTNIEILGRAL